MNPDLQDAVATVINRSLSGLDTATTFVKEQLPDIIRQLLTWTLAVNVAYIAMWFILLIVTLITWRRMSKKGIPHWKNEHPTVAGALHIVMGVATLLILILVVIPSTTQAIKVVVAPKLFLIDYVTDLAKSSSSGRR